MNFKCFYSLLQTLFGCPNFTHQLLKALLTSNYDKKSHLYKKKMRIRVYLEVILVLHSGCEFRRRELQFERALLTDWWWGRHGACAACQTDRMPSDEPCNTVAGRPVIPARITHNCGGDISDDNSDTPEHASNRIKTSYCISEC